MADDILGGLGIEVFADYSGLPADLDSALAIAQTSAGQISDALQQAFTAPDTAPFTDSLSALADAASQTGQAITAALNVSVEAPDLTPITDSLSAVADAAQTAGASISDSLSQPVAAPDTSAAEASYEALMGKASDVADQIGADFTRPIQAPDTTEFIAGMDAMKGVSAEVGASVADLGGALQKFLADEEAAGGGADAQAESLKTLEAGMDAAAEAAGNYAGSTQSIIDKQTDADEEWKSSKATLEELIAKFDAGEVSVSTLARATGDAEKAFAAAHPEIKKVADEAEEAKNALGGMAEKLLAFGEALAITEALREFGSEALHAADNITKADISLTAMTGDAETAKETIEGLEKLGISDGLSFPSLLIAGQRLTQLLPAGSDVVGLMGKIADGAAVSGASIDTVATKFGAIVDTGSLSIKTIKDLGLSFSDIGASMGMAGAKVDEIKKAFKALDEEGHIQILETALDKLHGTAQKVADETFSGQSTRLMNEWDQVLVSIGKDIMPIVTGLMGIVGADVLPFIKSLADDFAQLPAPIKDTAIGLGLMAVAVPVLGGALSGLSLVWGGLAAATGTFYSALQLLAGTTPVVAEEESALAAANALLAESAAAAASSEMELAGAEGAAGAGGAAASGGMALFGSTLAGLGLPALIAGLAAVALNVDGIADKIARWTGLQKVADDLNNAGINLKDWVLGLALGIDTADVALKSMKDSQDILASKSARLGTDFKAMDDAMKGVYDSAQSDTAAQIAHNAALVKAAQAAADFAAEQKKLQSVLEAAEGVINKLPAEYGDYVQKVQDGGATASAALKGIQSEIDKLNEKTAAMPAMAAQIQPLIDKLESARATAQEFADEDAFAKIGSQLGDLDAKAGGVNADLLNDFNALMDSLAQIPGAVAQHGQELIKWLQQAQQEQDKLDQQTQKTQKTLDTVWDKYVETTQSQVIPITATLVQRLGDVDTTANATWEHLKDNLTSGNVTNAVQQFLSYWASSWAIIKEKVDDTGTRVNAFGTDAQAAFNAAKSAAEAEAPALSTVAQRFVDMAHAVDVLKLTSTGLTQQQQDVITAFNAIATSANFSWGQTEAAFGQASGAIKELAQTDLPAAIKQYDLMINKLKEANAPQADILKIEAQKLQAEIDWAKRSGEDATAYEVQLEQVRIAIGKLGGEYGIQAVVAKQALKDIADSTDIVGKSAGVLMKTWNDAWDAVGKTLSDQLIVIDKTDSAWTKMLKGIEKEIVDGLIGVALKALRSEVDSLISSLIPSLGSAFTSVAGGISGSFTPAMTAASNAAQSAAINAATMGSNAASAAPQLASLGSSAGSAGSAASSVGGIFGSLGGTLNVVSGAVSAVTGVIGVFQNAAMESTMKLVELNTRISAIVEQKELPLSNQIAVQQEGTLNAIWASMLDTATAQYDRLGDIWGTLQDGFAPLAGKLDEIWDQIGKVISTLNGGLSATSGTTGASDLSGKSLDALTGIWSDANLLVEGVRNLALDIQALGDMSAQGAAQSKADFQGLFTETAAQKTALAALAKAQSDLAGAQATGNQQLIDAAQKELQVAQDSLAAANAQKASAQQTATSTQQTATATTTTIPASVRDAGTATQAKLDTVGQTIKQSTDAIPASIRDSGAATQIKMDSVGEKIRQSTDAIPASVRDAASATQAKLDTVGEKIRQSVDAIPSSVRESATTIGTKVDGVADGLTHVRQSVVDAGNTEHQDIGGLIVPGLANIRNEIKADIPTVSASIDRATSAVRDEITAQHDTTTAVAGISTHVDGTTAAIGRLDASIRGQIDAQHQTTAAVTALPPAIVPPITAAVNNLPPEIVPPIVDGVAGAVGGAVAPIIPAVDNVAPPIVAAVAASTGLITTAVVASGGGAAGRLGMPFAPDAPGLSGLSQLSGDVGAMAPTAIVAQFQSLLKQLNDAYDAGDTAKADGIRAQLAQMQAAPSTHVFDSQGNAIGNELGQKTQKQGDYYAAGSMPAFASQGIAGAASKKYSVAVNVVPDGIGAAVLAANPDGTFSVISHYKYPPISDDSNFVIPPKAEWDDSLKKLGVDEFAGQMGANNTAAINTANQLGASAGAGALPPGTPPALAPTWKPITGNAAAAAVLGAGSGGGGGTGGGASGGAANSLSDIIEQLMVADQEMHQSPQAATSLINSLIAQLTTQNQANPNAAVAPVIAELMAVVEQIRAGQPDAATSLQQAITQLTAASVSGSGKGAGSTTQVTGPGEVTGAPVPTAGPLPGGGSPGGSGSAGVTAAQVLKLLQQVLASGQQLTDAVGIVAAITGWTYDQVMAVIFENATGSGGSTTKPTGGSTATPVTGPGNVTGAPVPIAGPLPNPNGPMTVDTAAGGELITALNDVLKAITAVGDGSTLSELLAELKTIDKAILPASTTLTIDALAGGKLLAALAVVNPKAATAAADQQIPSLAIGGKILSDGLIYAHEGELIVPKMYATLPKLPSVPSVSVPSGPTGVSGMPVINVQNLVLNNVQNPRDLWKQLGSYGKMMTPTSVPYGQ